MKTQLDRRLVDPSVTDDDVERALDGTPDRYPDHDAVDLFQDDVDVVTEAKALLGVIPHTPEQAIASARVLRDRHTFVGIGMCLATVRGPIFGLPALWPDATAAIDHGAPIHRITDPVAIPKGTAVVWRNDRHSHIALGLGGGLCSTTDFHENGFEGVAQISRIEAWCGGTLVGFIETLNGFDVWPDPKKPKPKPKPWGLPEREREVRRALQKAKRNKAPARRIDGLARWDETLLARMEEHKLQRLR